MRARTRAQGRAHARARTATDGQTDRQRENPPLSSGSDTIGSGTELINERQGKVCLASNWHKNQSLFFFLLHEQFWHQRVGIFLPLPKMCLKKGEKESIVFNFL